MSDLNLSINIKAVDNASNALSGLANGIGANFGNAFGNLKFAMQNLGTEGTLTKDALVSAGGDMGKAMLGVGVAIAAIGTAAAIGIGTKAVDAAKDFQQSLLKIQAYAGLSKKETDAMSQSLLDMAGAVGVGPKELADALYPLMSAGYNASDALNMLKLSAETAAASGAKTSDVATGLSTVLKTFDIDASSSSCVMDVLNKTVAQGQMDFPGLTSVIGKLSLSASAAKVPFTDMDAALATLTTHGITSVSQASNALGNMFTQIGVKTDALAKHAKDAGVAFDAQKFSTMTLAEKMSYLSEITGGNQGKILMLLGGNNLALKSFNALSGGADDYAKTLQKLQNAHGTTAQVFATAQQGFNQQMNQAKASIDSLMIRIGTALLPVLGQLLAQVGPLIKQFVDWDAKHHVIENAVKGLGTAVSGLIGFVTTLITVITNVVHFFQQNEVAMTALKAVLITVGLLILAIVVPAFITWAIAAGSAAISTLILFAPLIALVAVIALVVFGIMMAVQHWGQIVAWLKGVWGGLSSWFMSMLHTLGAFFVGVWNGIVAGLKAAWAHIVETVKIGILILLAIIFAPIILIAALFIWLYQHNTYFKKLVDAIVDFFKACIAWIVSAWQAASAWLVGAWNDVVKFATQLWDKISKTIQAYFNLAVAYVQAVWNKISSFFVNAWNTYIAGPLTTLWTNVSTVFMNAWNTYIATPLTNIWNNVSKWFTDLGTSAMNSGINFIQMLVNGIASGAGAIWNAVVNIANTIWRALGFHSPAKEGPGAEADTWMPNLINMLSSDLTAGIPKIQAAVNLVAKPLATLGSPEQAATAAAGPVTTSSGDNNNIAIHVHLDGSAGTNAQKHGKDIADVVKKELAKHLRQQSIAPRYTSGGTHN